MFILLNGVSGQCSHFSPCSWCNTSLCASSPGIFLSSHVNQSIPGLTSSTLCFSPPAISCPPPPTIPNGQHNGNGTEEFAYNSVVMYMCDPGLQLVGNETLLCTTENSIDGVWSRSPPECRGECCWIIILFLCSFLYCVVN